MAAGVVLSYVTLRPQRSPEVSGNVVADESAIADDSIVAGARNQGNVQSRGPRPTLTTPAL
jgi:hypothetical protein